MSEPDSKPLKLKALRERAGLSMAAMAKALRYKGASSYQRYEDPTLFKKQELPLKLVRDAADILVGKGSPPITREEVLMLGGISELTTPQMRVLDEHRIIWCVGEVAAGVWRESFEWPADERVPVLMLPDERYVGIDRFALKVRGDSMNKLYPDGSFVVYVRFQDIGRGPRSGERVVALRHRHGLTEATVKEYHKDNQAQRWLIPWSTNPAHQSLLMDQADDGEMLDVIGLVVGSQRVE